MKYKTIIAEKPSVALSIAKIAGATEPHRTGPCGYIEGNGWRVTWAFGHLVGLMTPEQMGFGRSELPLLPSVWSTRVLGRRGKDGKEAEDENTKRQMATIERLFNGAEEIVVATDAGREGELIFRYIYEQLGCRTPFRRLWISSLTDEAIRKGLSSLAPGSDYDALSASAHARSRADWLVGFNASRALRLASGGRQNASLGRVQTPVLAMVCERHEQFTTFRPVPYWVLTADTEKGGTPFAAATGRYATMAEATQALRAAEGAGQLTVTDVQTRHTRQRPPLLHDLTSLQRLASSRHGLTASETLAAAQSLYEKKVTTYPRTGSRYIPDDVMREMPALLGKLAAHGNALSAHAAALEGRKLCTVSVDASKVTDHHALLPTGNRPEGLTATEEKIYTLIETRLLETLGEDYEADVTTAALDAGGTVFRTRGSVPTRMGWKAVEGLPSGNGKEDGKGGKDGDDGEDKDGDADQKLPPLSHGDRLPLTDCTMDERKTKPLPEYTDGTLLADMETCGQRIDDETLRESMKETGLGTPATRAQTIEKLVSMGYVERQGRKLLPTDRGMQVWRTVRGRRIADVRTTGEWERDLLRIERGEARADAFMEGIRKFTLEVIADIRANCRPADETPAGPCPLCGKPMEAQRYSLRCTGDGGCGLSIPREMCGRTLPENALKALLEGRTTAVIKGFESKAGRKFDAALRIDREERKVVFDFPDRAAAERKTSAAACPACGGALTDDGRKLSCGCGFTLWKTVRGKTLTDAQAEALARGESIQVTGMKSKAGKTFSATVTADAKTGKTTFSFDK